LTTMSTTTSTTPSPIDPNSITQITSGATIAPSSGLWQT
jgi:hypothetical protein